MKQWGVLIALVLVSAGARAGGWNFSESVSVTGPPREGIFHHLESAGRGNIATQGQTVAIAWEDNHTGQPAVYVAFKVGAGGFSKPLRVSGSSASYEPCVTATGEGDFLVAWEEAGAVYMRRAGPQGIGEATVLDRANAAQAALGMSPARGLYAAWTRADGPHRRVMAAALSLTDAGVEAGTLTPVDAAEPEADQLYPALAPTGSGVTVAWEDRRHGHTRLYYAHAEQDLDFGPMRQLNELLPARSAVYGRGTGVTRVALAGIDNGTVAATWMDKRNFRGGYDIYAAVSDDGGASFGPNEQVQDMFGANKPQWHPAVAVDASGQVVVAWDDPRDDPADIWLSWRQPGSWSDDVAPPGASGDGLQSYPAVAIDARGRLHLAFVARMRGEGTQVRYVSATPAP